MKDQITRSLSTLACTTFLAATASAQTGTAALAGVVRDTSGAVLPGATVEASSPALIEKVRVAVSDSNGQYRIVDVRPGIYAVTFTLPGFTTMRREGIELRAGFTATVNAELVVGALEETITVTGGSPLVDLQNTAIRNVIPADTLDALPTAKNFNAFAVLTVGVTAVGNNPSAEGAQPQDVGGSKGDTMVFMRYHGSHIRDALITVDGFQTNFLGFTRLFIPNPYASQETSLDLGGGTAAHRAGGVQLNIIPKSGGNQLRGDLFGTYTDGKFQSTNLSSKLRERGLTEDTLSRLDTSWDLSASLGGPIRQDELWFFTSHRQWGGGTFVANLFENATPNSLTYTPDFDRPAVNDFRSRSSNVRLTWQATPRQKFGLSYDWQHRCDCHRDITALTSPEAVNHRIYSPVNVAQATWNFPASNSLLFDAGIGFIRQQLNVNPQPVINSNAIAITEQTTNFTYGAMLGTYARWRTVTVEPRFSVSYVTGTHLFKAGIDVIKEWSNFATYKPNNVQYVFRNGSPVSLTQFAEPHRLRVLTNPDLGLFAQDQWTIDRLTLNIGARLDYLNFDFPAYSLPPVQLRAEELVFQKVSCIVCSVDFSPRLSASYDMFGTGQTALKFTLGRYPIGRTGTGGTTPASSVVRNASRSWTDDNGDFVPDCDLSNLAANGECGPISNARFGRPVPGTRTADDVVHDFRAYNWQLSASVEHVLRSGVAMSVGYFRTSWSNFTVTDNLSVDAASFDPYCIALPTDPRLPGGGGNELCGFHDITPARFGQVDNEVKRASIFGEQTDIYTGVDATVQARLPNGAMIGGGTSIGRQATARCFVVDSPEELLFCDVVPPYQAQIKLNAIYPLPWDLQLSGVFQSLPGIPISASYVATNSEIAPSLGRNLSGNRSTVTLANIVEPQTMFEGRSNQFDLRMTRTFRLGENRRIRGNLDVYNVLNASPVLATNTRYGPNWLAPTVILDGRLFKFSAQVSF